MLWVNLYAREDAEDAPTIGLLLCRTKNEVVAEYALRAMRSPMGVAEYQLIESLPNDLEESLPSVDRIEEELSCPHRGHRALQRRRWRKSSPPSAEAADEATLDGYPAGDIMLTSLEEGYPELGRLVNWVGRWRKARQPKARPAEIRAGLSGSGS